MKCRRGFTIVESLVVLAIVALLVAILTPVFLRAKRDAQIQSSISRMRQMWVGMEQYRRDYDGIDEAYDSFYALGLPTANGFFTSYLGFEKSFYVSPCGYDRVLFDSGISQMPGWITYMPPFYEPWFFERGYNALWRDYLATYRENAVAFVDPYCAEPGVSWQAPLVPKRVVAVTLGGRVINQLRSGNGSLLQFYSDIPK